MIEKRKDITWLDSLKRIYKSGEYNKLYPEMLSYIEKYPEDSYGSLLYGKLLLKLEKKEEAKKILEELSYSNSKLKYHSYILLATLYAEENQKELALQMIDNYLLGPYPLLDEAITIAEVYMKLDEQSKALELLKKLNIKDIRYSEMIRMSEIYNRVGNIEESERLLDKIDIQKMNNLKQLKMAEIRQNNESYTKALNIIERIISNTPSKDDVYYKCKYKQCEIFIKRNQLDEAINNCYEMILENNSDKDRIYLLLGDAYKTKYKFKEASENYNIATKSFDKDKKEEAIYKLGVLNDIAGNFEEAQIYYETLIETNSTYGMDAYYRMIISNIKNEKFEKALEIQNEMNSKYNKNKNYMANRIVSVFLNEKLGLPQEERNNYSYVENQIMNFSEEESKNHILTHRALSNSEFNKDIDFDDLYEYTKNNLTEENICYGDFLDAYEIEYQNVAPNANRYRVVSIPGTKNIITMYPIENKDKKYLKLSMFKKEIQRQELIDLEKKQKLYSKFNRK